MNSKTVLQKNNDYVKTKDFKAFVNKDFRTAKRDIGVLKTDVNILKKDVCILKKDVRILKTDVNILKKDVCILKTDVGVLKKDVKVLRTDFDEFREFTIKNMATKNDLLNLETRLETKIDESNNSLRREIMNSMDYIVKYVDEKRAEDAMQSHINMRHECWIKGMAKHTHYKLATDI